LQIKQLAEKLGSFEGAQLHTLRKNTEQAAFVSGHDLGRAAITAK
jgi:hypothetical protein